MSIEYCVKCGTRLDEKTKICPSCGKNYYSTHLGGDVPSKRAQADGRVNDKYLDDIKILKKFLDNDEKILLQSSINSRTIQSVLNNIFVGFIFGVTVMIGYIIVFFLVDFKDYFVELIIFITTFLFLIIIPSYPLIKGLRHYRLIKKTVQLPFRQLRKYNDVSILTNKRWIQKSLDLLKINFSYYPKDVIEILGDIIFIGIENIHLKDAKEWLYDTGFTSRSVYLNSFEAVPNPLHLGNIFGTSEYFKQFLKDAEQKVGIRRKILNNGSEVIHFSKL